MAASSFPPPRRLGSSAGCKPKDNGFRRNIYRWDSKDSADVLDDSRDRNGEDQTDFGAPSPKEFDADPDWSGEDQTDFGAPSPKEFDADPDWSGEDQTDFGAPPPKKIKLNSDGLHGEVATAKTHAETPLKNFKLFLPPKIPASILDSTSALQEFVHLTTANYVTLFELDVNMKKLDIRIPAIYVEKLSSKAKFLKNFITSVFSKISRVQTIQNFFAPKIVIHTNTNLSSIFEALNGDRCKINHIFLPLEVQGALDKKEMASFLEFLRIIKISKLTIVSSDLKAKKFSEEVADGLQGNVNVCIESNEADSTEEAEEESASIAIRPLVLARSINTRHGSPVKKDRKSTPKSKIVTKKKTKTSSYSTDCTYYDEAELTSQGSFTSEVWNLGSLHAEGIDGHGTTIAIIDSGINYNHPAFKNRILVVKNFVPDESEDFDCVIDSDGHGSLCAGIAAGSSCYCPTSSSPESSACLKIPPGVAPGSKLIICKVVKTSNGEVDSNAFLQALVWLKKMHQKNEFKVDVISISLSSEFYHHPRAQVISELSAMGVIIICCASNVGRLHQQPISFPARLGHVLCIGAQDENGKPASFSPVGRELDFLAPGDDIWGPGCGMEGPFSMNCASGTSCATPGMAGLVCLILCAVAAICKRDPKKFVIGGKSLLEHVHNVWIMRELLKEMSSSPGHHSDEIGHGTLTPSRLLARSDDEIMRVIDSLVQDE